MDPVLEWLLRELEEKAKLAVASSDQAERYLEAFDHFRCDQDYRLAKSHIEDLADNSRDLQDMVREARQRIKEGRAAA